MKTGFITLFLSLLCGFTNGQNSGLRQEDFFTEEQGLAELRKLESMYSNKEEWESRRQMLRTVMLEGLNLSPLPRRTPLNAVISSNRVKDGLFSVTACLPGRLKKNSKAPVVIH